MTVPDAVEHSLSDPWQDLSSAGQLNMGFGTHVLIWLLAASLLVVEKRDAYSWVFTSIGLG